MLLISLAIAGAIIGADQARERVFTEAHKFLGEEGATFVANLVDRASALGSDPLATGVSIVLLLVGATGAFFQLSVALNRMWEIKADPKRGWLRIIRKRALSFGFVLVIAVLLLASLVVSAVLSALGDILADLAPGMRLLMQLLGYLATIGIVTVLFALLFQFLPDAKIAWSDVWLGAFVTAVLFEIGKLLFGIYLGRATVGSNFGAAGSLVLILVWTWFASQIVFVGAEFTQVYARRQGKPIEPEPHARRTGPVARP